MEVELSTIRLIRHNGSLDGITILKLGALEPLEYYQLLWQPQLQADRAQETKQGEENMSVICKFCGDRHLPSDPMWNSPWNWISNHLHYRHSETLAHLSDALMVTDFADLERTDFLNCLPSSLQRDPDQDRTGSVIQAMARIRAGKVDQVKLCFDKGKFTITEGKHRLEAHTLLGSLTVKVDMDKDSKKRLKRAMGNLCR